MLKPIELNYWALLRLSRLLTRWVGSILTQGPEYYCPPSKDYLIRESFAGLIFILTKKDKKSIKTYPQFL